MQTLKQYLSIGSIVKRNNDGKEFTISSYDEMPDNFGQYVSLDSDESNHFEFNECDGSYQVVIVKSPPKYLVDKMNILDRKIARAVAKFQSEMAKRTHGMSDEIQERVEDGLSYSLGLDDMYVERKNLMSLMVQKSKKVKTKYNFSEEVSLEVVDFSMRTFNILSRNKIKTVSDLVKLSLNDVKQIRNVSPRTIAEIESVIGIKFV